MSTEKDNEEGDTVEREDSSIPTGLVESIGEFLDSYKRHFSNVCDSFTGGLTSAKEAIKKIIAESENESKIGEGEKCSVCEKPISGFEYYSLESYLEEEGSPPKLVDRLDVCSAECLKELIGKGDYKDKNHYFYRNSRCASYYDCKDLGNLRSMCEKQELLNFEKGNMLLPNLAVTNFCEPGQAGIIKASINLNKQLEEFRKETKRQHILTVAMTLLVIFLTAVNVYLVLQEDVPAEIRGLSVTLYGIQNQTYSSINDLNGKTDAIAERIGLLLEHTINVENELALVNQNLLEHSVLPDEYNNSES